MRHATEIAKSMLRTNMDVKVFGRLKVGFDGHLQMTYTLRRSAVRKVESTFFWTGLRRLLGTFKEVCPEERRQV